MCSGFAEHWNEQMTFHWNKNKNMFGAVTVITICSCIDVHGGVEYDRQNNCENTVTNVYLSDSTYGTI